MKQEKIKSKIDIVRLIIIAIIVILYIFIHAIGGIIDKNPDYEIKHSEWWFLGILSVGLLLTVGIHCYYLIKLKILQKREHKKTVF